MIYRKIDKEESLFLADIHLEAFKGFFLTTLGKEFLKAYYKACLQSRESIGICAVDSQDHLVGFSLGCIQSRGFHKRLVKKNFLPFLIQGVIILFSRPKALLRLAHNLDKNTDKTDYGNYAELLSIAVSPEIRGVGIGNEMIKRFEQEAINKGCLKIALTTDIYKNEAVLKFYKSNGYSVFYEFTGYPKRKMYRMIKDLNGN